MGAGGGIVAVEAIGYGQSALNTCAILFILGGIADDTVYSTTIVHAVEAVGGV